MIHSNSPLKEYLWKSEVNSTVYLGVNIILTRYVTNLKWRLITYQDKFHLLHAVFRNECCWQKHNTIIISWSYNYWKKCHCLMIGIW